VSDEPLFSLGTDVQGRMLGVGSQNGSLTLIQPSESLVELQRQEKAIIGAVSFLDTSQDIGSVVRVPITELKSYGDSGNY